MISEESFTIDTELTPLQYPGLLDFIRHNYLLPHPKIFTDVSRKKSDGNSSLTFTARGPEGGWRISAEVKPGNPIQVKMAAEGEAAKALERLRLDLVLNVQLFEENVRKTTLYFAWVKGEKIIPEKPPSLSSKSSGSIFSSSMMFLYVTLFAVNIVLFILFGLYAVVGILAVQLGFVLFADRIFLRLGEFKITERNREVHVLQYRLPVEEYKEFQEKYGKDAIVKMKTEIYDRTLAAGKAPSCELGRDVLKKYGVKCNPKRESARAVDVYGIVKRAAEKFGLPVPKITVSNSTMPNAAANGPSPGRGVVLITTGLLAQLNDDEILNVVGHELGHLQGRDPLILFGLTSGEFILRILVLFTLPIFTFLPFLYLYFLVALGVVYFIAKFFEARADLASAIKIGQPAALAEALQKIGHAKLQYEKLPAYKMQSWVRFDTHPPIYFRIDRLKKMKTPVQVKHPLVQSVKDVFRGFRSAF